jgi:hypothetical protein
MKLHPSFYNTHQQYSYVDIRKILYPTPASSGVCTSTMARKRPADSPYRMALLCREEAKAVHSSKLYWCMMSSGFQNKDLLCAREGNMYDTRHWDDAPC